MNKLLLLLALMLLLTACTPAAMLPGTTGTAPSTTVTTSPSQTFSFFIYTPDDAFEGFVSTQMTLHALDPELIVAALIEKGVLARDVAVNDAIVDGAKLQLDMNEAFLMQMYTMGTSGERMLIGCLVNTFLSAYNCEYVMLTVNGDIINSDHVVYDEPLYPFT